MKKDDKPTKAHDLTPRTDSDVADSDSPPPYRVDGKRRKLLKNTGGVAAGAALLLPLMPKKWQKPAIDVVALPVHAQTSPAVATTVAITTAPTTTATAAPVGVTAYTLTYEMNEGRVRHDITLESAVPGEVAFRFRVNFGGVTGIMRGSASGSMGNPEMYTVYLELPEGVTGTYTSALLESDAVMVASPGLERTVEIPAPTTTATAAPVGVTAYTLTYEMNEGRVRHDITLESAVPGEVAFRFRVNFGGVTGIMRGSASGSMGNPEMYTVYLELPEGVTGTYTSALLESDAVMVASPGLERTVEIPAPTTTAATTTAGP